MITKLLQQHSQFLYAALKKDLECAIIEGGRERERERKNEAAKIMV
jgi:hypothetical protein